MSLHSGRIRTADEIFILSDEWHAERYTSVMEKNFIAVIEEKIRLEIEAMVLRVRMLEIEAEQAASRHTSPVLRSAMNGTR
jgi:hypothetical protein